jgi:MoxR-like ATPase
VNDVKQWADRVAAAVEKVFLGKHEVTEKLLAALLCRGHVLLEDVPGLGKTILARALSAALGGSFSRIQCTPDLLPADILGVSVYNPKEGTFSYRRGPILANLVLVDEINRATPRTQAALLEAMAENQVSIEGKQTPLPDPFFLMATENPVEFEGTFPLPEAQKDRFLLCLSIGYPELDIERRIVEDQRRIEHPVQDVHAVTDTETIRGLQEEVVKLHVEEDVLDYILQIVRSSREDPAVRIGGSPRGALALYKSSQALAAIRGRDYVVPEDVKEMTVPVLIQRIILKAEAMLKGRQAKEIIETILDRTPVPIMKEA